MFPPHMIRLLPVVLCITFIECSKTPSQIRVQNLTGHDFTSVAVNTNRFGALKTGAISESRTVQVVFAYASVYTTETNTWVRNDRFIGGNNPPQPSGSYTYVLTLATNGGLQVALKKE